MFLQLNNDKLINLYWLDDVQKEDIDNNGVITYCLSYIMVNGTKYLEEYANEATRNSAYTTLINKLIS